MKFKSIVAAAAIALAAATASVSAAEITRPVGSGDVDFAVLDAVHADQLRADDLAKIRGSHVVIDRSDVGKSTITIPVVKPNVITVKINFRSAAIVVIDP